MSYGKVDVKEEKTSFRTKNINVKFVNDQFTDLKDQIYLTHQVDINMDDIKIDDIKIDDIKIDGINKDDINISSVDLFMEAKLYRAKGEDVDRYD